MIELSREQKWNAISLGAAVVAAVVVRRGIRAAWKMARDDSPPLNPLREDSTWTDAILFSLATGMAVGLARLGARALAAATLPE
jgi:hypothetical protein